MAPMFGSPNYDFYDDDHSKVDVENDNTGLTEMAFWYMIVLIGMLLLWLLLFFCLRTIALRQKTRSPQQRRPYIGTRGRPSLTPQEPTIYVSPANLPPPPKYEAMAPPSYEEVVGIHYPGYQPPGQPITAPITTAMAQTPHTSDNNTNNNTNNTTVNGANPPSTVITVTADSRTAVTVATS